MRQMIVLLAVAFAGAFAYTVGSRMAGESRALLAGVAIGMVVSVPAALIAAVVASRMSAAPRLPVPPESSARPMAAPAPPSVVIVNPGQGTRSTRYAPYVETLLDPPPPRTFTIVGEDDDRQT